MSLDDLEIGRIADEVDRLRMQLGTDIDHLVEKWPDLVGITFRQAYSTELADCLTRFSRELAALGEAVARIGFDLTDGGPVSD
ncbi:hypothetical protein CcI49_14795 [Frankia sp. CcI49]|uniref:hypothetical protein n=1 Tax=Frankia sp. CcI49 TaxID=1745382 RepID=UPI000976DE99|nr:hypothetical protein [Frankia sp. CcI49]ONH59972.1 hypothetical protein CcI49_14795 [Frankia sp. CcI49]